MNRNPATISPQANLYEVLALMAERKLRHIVVMESDAYVLGILSEQYLALYYDPVQMTEERWRQATVGTMMTRKPVTIGSGAPIREAARLLLRSAISALPVVDNGILVGVLSDRAFTRYFAQAEGWARTAVPSARGQAGPIE